MPCEVGPPTLSELERKRMNKKARRLRLWLEDICARTDETARLCDQIKKFNPRAFKLFCEHWSSHTEAHELYDWWVEHKKVDAERGWYEHPIEEDQGPLDAERPPWLKYPLSPEILGEVDNARTEGS